METKRNRRVRCMQWLGQRDLSMCFGFIRLPAQKRSAPPRTYPDRIFQSIKDGERGEAARLDERDLPRGLVCGIKGNGQVRRVGSRNLDGIAVWSGIIDVKQRCATDWADTLQSEIHFTRRTRISKERSLSGRA